MAVYPLLTERPLAKDDLNLQCHEVGPSESRTDHHALLPAVRVRVLGRDCAWVWVWCSVLFNVQRGAVGHASCSCALRVTRL